MKNISVLENGNMHEYDEMFRCNIRMTAGFVLSLSELGSLAASIAVLFWNTPWDTKKFQCQAPGFDVCILQGVPSLIFFVYYAVVVWLCVFKKTWNDDVHLAIRPILFVFNTLMCLCSVSLCVVEGVLLILNPGWKNPLLWLSIVNGIQTALFFVMTVLIDISLRPRGRNWQ